jgi:hypothetical protein
MAIPRDLLPLFTLAAIAALAASVFWMRLAIARGKVERDGGPATSQWLTEAATATSVTLFIGAAGFFLVIFW